MCCFDIEALSVTAVWPVGDRSVFFWLSKLANVNTGVHRCLVFSGPIALIRASKLERGDFFKLLIVLCMSGAKIRQRQTALLRKLNRAAAWRMAGELGLPFDSPRRVLRRTQMVRRRHPHPRQPFAAKRNTVQ